MDVGDALRRRRMVRSFDGAALKAPLVEGLFADSLRAPTAGNARGVEWFVLVGTDEVLRYFEAATDERWRSHAARAPGLMRAAAVGVCVADPGAYLERYGEDDKASSGLGMGTEVWPVSYWIGDAGAATMAALLLAEEHGLGAAFLGAFRRDAELKAALSIPATHVIYGAVLLGHPDGGDRRSASLERPGPTRASRVHRLAP